MSVTKFVGLSLVTGGLGFGGLRSCSSLEPVYSDKSYLGLKAGDCADYRDREFRKDMAIKILEIGNKKYRYCFVDLNCRSDNEGYLSDLEYKEKVDCETLEFIRNEK